MQAELRGLQRRLGVAALFVTHDQAEAMALADRVAVMREGVVEQVDTPERLWAAPANAWVCGFIGAGNLLRGPLSRTPAGQWRMHLAPGIAFDAEGAAPGAMFVPADRVRLHPAPEGTGLPVSGRRFLGGGVEVSVATPAGVVATVVPLAEAGDWQPGRPVLLSARACRMLPDPPGPPRRRDPPSRLAGARAAVLRGLPRPALRGAASAEPVPRQRACGCMCRS